jgi:hypothetical protein
MVDVSLGGFRGERLPHHEHKLVRFPNVTEGRLADAIALLKAPGSEAELRSEARFRHMYRSAAGSWPLPLARRNRLSVVVGVASLASVFATATGLSAASVLPAPASHVVNGILGPLNGSPTTPPPTATQPVAHGGSVTSASGNLAPLAAGTPTSATNAGATVSAPTTTACRQAKSSCTVHHRHSLHTRGTSVGTSTGANQAVRSSGGSPQTTGAAPTGSVPPSTGTTSVTTDGTGSGSAPGTSSGGNTGSGSGSTAPTGTNRGGNDGIGSGSGGTGGRGTGHHAGRNGSGKGAGAGKGAAAGKGAGSGGRHHRGDQAVRTGPSTTIGTTTPDSTGTTTPDSTGTTTPDSGA